MAFFAASMSCAPKITRHEYVALNSQVAAFTQVQHLALNLWLKLGIIMDQHDYVSVDVCLHNDNEKFLLSRVGEGVGK